MTGNEFYLDYDKFRNSTYYLAHIQMLQAEMLEFFSNPDDENIRIAIKAFFAIHCHELLTKIIQEKHKELSGEMVVPAYGFWFKCVVCGAQSDDGDIVNRVCMACCDERDAKEKLINGQD